MPNIVDPPAPLIASTSKWRNRTEGVGGRVSDCSNLAPDT
jgi:hypothetical protein